MRFIRQNPDDSQLRRVSTEGPRTQVAENFQLREFQCRDGTDVLLLHPRLVRLVQRVRSHFGRPVRVDSGFRTHAHNANIGGAERSRHLMGMAADIVITGVDPSEVADYAASLDVGGLGRYWTFTHLDVQGYNRRWDYR